MSPAYHLFHRIHLMAGRVPQGADRAAVRAEMETVFLENLRHAAGVLAQVRGGNTYLIMLGEKGLRSGDRR